MANRNHQWDRVQRTPQDPGEAKRQKANKDILESDVFKAACVLAGIDPTQRQASKYRRKRGRAYLWA